MKADSYGKQSLGPLSRGELGSACAPQQFSWFLNEEYIAVWSAEREARPFPEGLLCRWTEPYFPDAQGQPLLSPPYTRSDDWSQCGWCRECGEH